MEKLTNDPTLFDGLKVIAALMPCVTPLTSCTVTDHTIVTLLCMCVLCTVQLLELGQALDKLQGLVQRIRRKFKAASKVPSAGIKGVVYEAAQALVAVTAARVKELCDNASQLVSKTSSQSGGGMPQGPPQELPLGDGTGSAKQPDGDQQPPCADGLVTQTSDLPSEVNQDKLDALLALKNAAAALGFTCSLNPCSLCSDEQLGKCEQQLQAAWRQLQSDASRVCHSSEPFTEQPTDLTKGIEAISARISAQITAMQPELAAHAAGTRRTLRHACATTTVAQTATTTVDTAIQQTTTLAPDDQAHLSDAPKAAPDVQVAPLLLHT